MTTAVFENPTADELLDALVDPSPPKPAPGEYRRIVIRVVSGERIGVDEIKSVLARHNRTPHAFATDCRRARERKAAAHTLATAAPPSAEDVAAAKRRCADARAEAQVERDRHAKVVAEHERKLAGIERRGALAAEALRSLENDHVTASNRARQQLSESAPEELRTKLVQLAREGEKLGRDLTIAKSGVWERDESAARRELEAAKERVKALEAIVHDPSADNKDKALAELKALAMNPAPPRPGHAPGSRATKIDQLRAKHNALATKPDAAAIESRLSAIAREHAELVEKSLDWEVFDI
jgi:hypothetical protein